jgi:uncharacterized coiled-coil DUF342 family protein
MTPAELDAAVLRTERSRLIAERATVVAHKLDAGEPVTADDIATLIGPRRWLHARRRARRARLMQSAEATQ